MAPDQSPDQTTIRSYCKAIVHTCAFIFPNAGDGLGLKVVGGREISGTNMIGAYIQNIHPSLSMNEIKEGLC